MDFNDSLIKDANALIRSSMGWGKRTLAVAMDFTGVGARNDLRRTFFLDPEARDVLRLAQSAKPTPPEYSILFDEFVHDSLAGFNKALCELPGYWRYRKVFQGNDGPVIASNQEIETTREIA
ncbi:hypothetical protein [Massilia horti]|uniref:Uncharacterized protein n=1 Tax=Massilia horti TaxID=2562153 RepID=A0A4Y9T320_9BURK|nr:hypothetical protein [Massilia horti]TFW33604.1 hypothetical protein E4O92_06315 [Massilia horti]